MRRPPSHRDDRGGLGVTMTPMIDVIFQLLVFFVSTAGFQPAEEVLPANLSLPGTVSEAPPIDQELEDLDEIVVRIMWRDGRPSWQIGLPGQQLHERVCRDLEEVTQALAAIARVKVDLPVILDVEAEVPIEDVIDVYDVCRRIGLERIQFAASAGE